MKLLKDFEFYYNETPPSFPIRQFERLDKEFNLKRLFPLFQKVPKFFNYGQFFKTWPTQIISVYHHHVNPHLSKYVQRFGPKKVKEKLNWASIRDVLALGNYKDLVMNPYLLCNNLKRRKTKKKLTLARIKQICRNSVNLLFRLKKHMKLRVAWQINTFCKCPYICLT